MYKMLIDTCVWFDLAKNHNREELLRAIEEMVRRGALSLLVPQILLDEFRRNQERITKENTKSLTSNFRVVREALTLLKGGAAKKRALLLQLDKAVEELPAVGRSAELALARIDKLLAGFPILEASDAVVRAAAQRGIEKRAPFHHPKNSIADAMLVEIYAECEEKEPGVDSRFAFVSSNTTDFSREHGNQKLPHPDLANIFSSPRSRYFISLEEALADADLSVVSEVRREDPTLGDLLRRHISERTKPLGQSHRYVLQRLLSLPIADKPAATLRASDILSFVRKRVTDGVTPQTAKHDVVYLRGTLDRARTEWHVNVSTDFIDQAMPILLRQNLISKSAMRDRRPTNAEYKRLVRYFIEQDAKPGSQIKMTDLVESAVYSARRRGEICKLKWVDLNEIEETCVVRNVVYPRQASKDHTFPLLGRALEIIQKQDRSSAYIFPYNARSVGASFTRAMKRLKIRDLHFDDLRNEAVTRLLEENVPVQEILKLTGHKHADPLIRKYEKLRKVHNPGA